MCLQVCVCLVVKMIYDTGVDNTTTAALKLLFTLEGEIYFIYKYIIIYNLIFSPCQYFYQKSNRKITTNTLFAHTGCDLSKLFLFSCFLRPCINDHLPEFIFYRPSNYELVISISQISRNIFHNIILSFSCSHCGWQILLLFHIMARSTITLAIPDVI